MARFAPLFALSAFIAAPAMALPAAAPLMVEAVRQHESLTVQSTASRLSVVPMTAPVAIAALGVTKPASAKVAPRQFGPFRVVSESRVEMIGATDARTPMQFAEMLAKHPGVRELVMVEAPGTHDDRANLELGRLIRDADMTTIAPANGSVRSGAVELFLAGARRVIEDGAEFAVHSWRDRNGREADDYGADAKQHRAYLDYYADIGMDRREAAAFYDMTNSVSHDDARWLTAADMRRWVGTGSAQGATGVLASADAKPLALPALALLDLALLDRSVLGGWPAGLSMLDMGTRNG